MKNVGEKDDKGDDGDDKAKHVRNACFPLRYQNDSSSSNPLYPPHMEQSSDYTESRYATKSFWRCILCKLLV